jgi:hypothetical protein
LTLGGLLTGEQVRTSSPAGWTAHDKWDLEQTLWLRWKFISAERLPDLPAQPQPLHRTSRTLGNQRE